MGRRDIQLYNSLFKKGSIEVKRVNEQEEMSGFFVDNFGKDLTAYE